MTNQEFQGVEEILARYKPTEAPADLLRRVEQRASYRRRPWRELLIAAMSAAAEVVLAVGIRGLITGTTVIVLLLVASKGY